MCVDSRFGAYILAYGEKQRSDNPMQNNSFPAITGPYSIHEILLYAERSKGQYTAG